MVNKPRIVITGIGLTAPNGNSLQEFRKNLLTGVSGVVPYSIRYFGDTVAGVCTYDPKKYQSRKDLRYSTRAGSISIYCANEAVREAKIDWASVDKKRVGVFIGTTEHGNVETEHQIYEIRQFNDDVKYWSHYHNPRTVSNNPAGEVTINMGITGPHFVVGAACAAGNLGIIQGVQQLILGEVDLALAGGVSESIHTFGIFAAFNNQQALGKHADPAKVSRPFDRDRNGIVIAEGGAVYALERFEDAQARGATILAEIAGYAYNSDATDLVLPNAERQAECMALAVERSGMKPQDIHLINTHATSTPQGDKFECDAVRKVFANCPDTWVNNTKGFIGHAMGAAGALELAGNIPAFADMTVHPTINVEHLDPECDIPGLVVNQPKTVARLDTILNNSFGMIGINAVLVVKRFVG
jgi:3-oxoacyl-[acyl-carrier-protein] synthase II